MDTISKRSLAIAAVAAVALAVPTAGSAGSEADPTAKAAKACKSINTRNGGRAEVIRTTGRLSCRTARRVAHRARGKASYRALGFSCEGTRLRSGEYRRLYGCGRVAAGRSQGIGFFWKKR
jgi:hypothetical protein